jgi:hypothetical protein
MLLIFLFLDGADEGDTVLHQTLNPTWAIICRTMGAEFEPYLSAVIPPLIGVLAASMPSLYPRCDPANHVCR